MLALLLAAQLFTLEGRTEPPARASVTLAGSLTPFNAHQLTLSNGRFKFTRLDEGSYTLDVFVPGLGSVRRTVVVNESTADKKRTVQVVVQMEDGRARPDRSSVVSMKDLSIPDRAKAAYADALRQLSRKNVPAAITQLERAIEIAPLYADAWNHLGTIHYMAKRYSQAESCFRKALEADLDAYAPLVNLGGVLLNLNRPDEAIRYNQYAVLREPLDALAHSQLGMNYYALGRLDLAERSLKEAIRLDAAHFSLPYLTLADIYRAQGRTADAQAALEAHQKLHPKP